MSNRSVVAGKRRRARMADRADRYELYEAAVHDAKAEISFIRRTFKALRGRRPLIFREDFSGPASAACEWVRSEPRGRAIAVDIEKDVLDWGSRNRLGRLRPQARRRITLVNADVLTVRTKPVDVVAALNFSYWVFKSRPLLLRYFRNARRALNIDGLLVLDAFGGYEAVREVKERTRYRGFTYVWDQVRFRPVTGDLECHIHFHFPDGSRIEKAFVYNWRLWSLPELQELLTEAGFRRVTVFWEGDDGEGGGNGEFTPEAQGQADATWIAYLVAER